MDVILEKVRKGEKEPVPIVEIGPEMLLRAAEDRKLKNLIDRIVKERRKLIEKGKRGSELRTLSEKEIAELIAYYKTPRILESMPGDGVFTELSLQTGVEWVAVKFKSGSVWLKTDGKKREVGLFIHKDIVEVIHTHPEGSTLKASTEDLKALDDLIEAKAKIQLFRIVMGGEKNDIINHIK